MFWPHVGHVDHSQQPGSVLRHVTRGLDFSACDTREGNHRTELADRARPGLQSPLYTVSTGRWLGLQWLITTCSCYDGYKMGPGHEENAFSYQEANTDGLIRSPGPQFKSLIMHASV